MINKILGDSFEHGWIVTIIYQRGVEITQRDIEVKAIDGNKIRAYCHLRHQIRTFDIGNILAADYCRKRVSV